MSFVILDGNSLTLLIREDLKDCKLRIHHLDYSSVLKFNYCKNISQSICGNNTGRSWTCTTWEYGQFPYDKASFTFSGDSPDSLILNNFSIDKD